MSRLLLDSNVLLDIAAEEGPWFDWPCRMLRLYGETHSFCINPVIFAEVSYRFARFEEIDRLFPESVYERLSIPYEAAFLAAQCHRQYRKRGGHRASTLPDFFIGAHAFVEGMTLLTRDRTRYASYFPKLKIVAPGK